MTGLPGEWMVTGYREVAHFIPDQPRWLQSKRSSLCERLRPGVGLKWEQSTSERRCAPCIARLAMKDSA